MLLYKTVYRIRAFRVRILEYNVLMVILISGKSRLTCRLHSMIFHIYNTVIILR